jgi:hypothetical protein
MRERARTDLPFGLRRRVSPALWTKRERAGPSETDARNLDIAPGAA